jgi:cytochrome b6
MARETKRLGGWLDDRIGLGALREQGMKKTVPLHRHAAWYYFGGMTLFLFCVQVATGILLMLYYRPSADEAYESVQFIMSGVPFGWLIRSLHSWSANLMVATAFIHLFSVFFLKAYRPPRELTWVSGFLLLLLAMGFGFSGYLLPWNKLAFFATQVGTDIAGVVPVVGEVMLRFLRGGDHVTGGTLSRFYGWHVAILPAITVSLLLLHLLMVQRHGMSVPPSVERRLGNRVRHIPFFPDFLLRDLFGWVLAVGVLAALAALFPWELGEKADPFAPAFADIKPEWYFMFMFQTLKYVPGGSILGVENEAWAIMGFGFLGLLSFLVPFLDRDGSRKGRSTAFTVIGAVGLAYVAILTSLGYHAWWPVVSVVVLVIGPWLVGQAMKQRRRAR